MDISNLTIKEILVSLKEKKFSVSEMVSAYLNRIEKYDEKIKAFLLVNKEEIKKKAKELDESDFEENSLFGIPVGMKDNYLTEGIETTAASRILKGFVPPYNATVWEKLSSAKSLLLGKTNMDAFAHGSSTENSDFQVTHNPWDLERVPGGSSGGSAAAIAASFCPFAFGTDTGGSIRQPAGFCGVVGYKSSYGLLSRYGVVAMGSSTDSIGFFTQTVEDTAIVLPFIMGKDGHDSNVVGKEFDLSEKVLNQDLKGKKIGLPKEFFVEGLDSRVRDLVVKAAKEYEKLGVEVVEVSLPHSKYGIPVYYVQIAAEVSSNLSRHDGIRYHYSVMDEMGKMEIKNIEDIYLKTKGKGFGAEAKRRIMLGTYVLSSGYYDAYYEKARKVRVKIREDFEKAFKKVDMLLTPTSPSLPFKIGENIDDPLQMYLSDIFTVTANLAGIPGLSFPCGFVDGLPVGMQLLGSAFRDDEVLKFGYQYQKVTNWHEKKPELNF